MINQSTPGPSPSKTQLMRSLGQMGETSNGRVDLFYLDQLPRMQSSHGHPLSMVTSDNYTANPKY